MKRYLFIGASIFHLFSYSQIAHQDIKQFGTSNSKTKTVKSKLIVSKVLYVSTYKWEAICTNNSVVFGIAPSYDTAMSIISSFGRRNQSNKFRFNNYSYSVTIIKTFIPGKEKEDIYKTFYRIGSKDYKILSKDELFALDIFSNFDREKGIHYFQKLKNINPIIAEKRLETLLRVSNKYRIQNTEK